MDFFEWIGAHLKELLDSFLKLLPSSPIVYLEKTPQISTIISYINWFCPIYLWISILENWLVAIVDDKGNVICVDDDIQSTSYCHYGWYRVTDSTLANNSIQLFHINENGLLCTYNPKGVYFSR